MIVHACASNLTRLELSTIESLPRHIPNLPTGCTQGAMRDMIFPVPRLLKFLAKHVSLAPGGCRNEATIGVRYPSNRHTSARIDAYTHAHVHAHAHTLTLTPTPTSPLPVQQGTCSSPEHRSVNCNAPSRTHTRCTHTHTPRFHSPQTLPPSTITSPLLSAPLSLAPPPPPRH